MNYFQHFPVYNQGEFKNIQKKTLKKLSDKRHKPLASNLVEIQRMDPLRIATWRINFPGKHFLYF